MKSNVRSLEGKCFLCGAKDSSGNQETPLMSYFLYQCHMGFCHCLAPLGDLWVLSLLWEK